MDSTIPPSPELLNLLDRSPTRADILANIDAIDRLLEQLGAESSEEITAVDKAAAVWGHAAVVANK